MENLRENINRFFHAYASRFHAVLSDAEADVEGTVQSFANYFIGKVKRHCLLCK